MKVELELPDELVEELYRENESRDIPPGTYLTVCLPLGARRWTAVCHPIQRFRLIQAPTNNGSCRRLGYRAEKDAAGRSVAVIGRRAARSCTSIRIPA